MFFIKIALKPLPIISILTNVINENEKQLIRWGIQVLKMIEKQLSIITTSNNHNIINYCIINYILMNYITE